MDFSGRIPIKCLFISKYVKTRSKNPCQYDIAIITPDDKYIEYELVVRQQLLTPFVASRIKQLFSEYRIGYDTSVCITDTILESDPIYVYLTCLGQQIGFDVHTAGVEKILQRIQSYRYYIFKFKPGMKARRCDLQKIWRKMVETKLCPWITDRYNERLMKMSDIKIYKKQIIRLGGYYMLIKRHMLERDKKSKAKRRKRENLNSENAEYNLKD